MTNLNFPHYVVITNKRHKWLAKVLSASSQHVEVDVSHLPLSFPSIYLLDKEMSQKKLDILSSTSINVIKRIYSCNNYKICI